VKRVGSWTTLQPQIALGRWWATSATVAGQPYICGGMEASLGLGSVERFVEDDQRWEALPSLLQARYGAVCGVLTCRDLSMW